MTNIVFIQPIFAPDEGISERNVNSLQSIKNYIDVNGLDGCNVQVIIGGWARTDALWQKMVAKCKEVFGATYEPIRFDKNYGKAIVVNKLYEVARKNGVNPDFLFTCDSDILFQPEQKHMFLRLVAAANHLTEVKKIPFGMISLNQLSGNCHWPVCYQNQITYTMSVNATEKFEEKMVWPNTPSGIAGGCLFLSRAFWDTVGGYKVFGVYSGDDAYLLLECGKRGWSYQMADTISIIHPNENDAEYSAWKHKVCGRDMMSGFKQNIDNIIQEADAFWDAKK